MLDQRFRRPTVETLLRWEETGELPSLAVGAAARSLQLMGWDHATGFLRRGQGTWNSMEARAFTRVVSATEDALDDVECLMVETSVSSTAVRNLFAEYVLVGRTNGAW